MTSCLACSPRSANRKVEKEPPSSDGEAQELRDILSQCVKAELQLFQHSVEHIMREELQAFMKGCYLWKAYQVPGNGDAPVPCSPSRGDTKTLSNHGEVRITETRQLPDKPARWMPVLPATMPRGRSRSKEMTRARSNDEVVSQVSDHPHQRAGGSEVNSEVGSRGYAMSNRNSNRSDTMLSSHGRASHISGEQSSLVNRRQSYFRAPSNGSSKKSTPKVPPYSRIAEESDEEPASSRALIVMSRQETGLQSEGSRRVAGQTWVGHFKAMEESSCFDVGVGLVIILNAISIGLETEYMASRWTNETPVAFEIVNGIFCAIFSLEIALRLYVHRLSYFNPESDDFSWKLFDFFVVVTQLAESIYSFDTGKSVRAMRVIRLLRTFRIIRTARLLRLFRELRVLIVSITGAMRPFVWIIVLIVGITYTFAVFITQLVTDYKVRYRGAVENEERVLEDLYGSLGRSMLILYQMATKGLPWGKGSEPLRVHIAHWLAIVFAAYMTFLLCGLMNVVTGAFIRTAAGIADDDKKNLLRRQMESMFQEVDEDQSGTITVEEFNNVLGKKQFQDYLKEIDLNPEQAGALYKLIDTDGTGDVEFAEVVDGCLRLHGPAKSIDLLPFVKEVLREMEALRHMIDDLNGRHPPPNTLCTSTYPTPLGQPSHPT